MFYTLIKHRFLTNQSARRVLSMLQKAIKNSFRVYIVESKHPDSWKNSDSIVMQTLDCVQGLHNCLEFSLVSRWDYVNSERVFNYLNKFSAHDTVSPSKERPCH